MSQASTRPTEQIITTADELEELLSRDVIAREPIPIREGVLCPTSFEGVQRLAKFVFASKMVPKGVDTLEQCMMLIAAGQEAGLGLGQTVKGCMIVNMRPSIWGDVALGLVRRSPLCESVKEWIDDNGVARCRCKRKGEPEPIDRSFSEADAKRAGLWGKQGPWSGYPQRMLQMRARAFALRDAFPDVLCGLSIVEEQLDIEPEDAPSSETRGVTSKIDKLPDPGPASTNGHSRRADAPTTRPEPVDGESAAGNASESSGPRNPPAAASQPVAAGGRSDPASDAKRKSDDEFLQGLDIDGLKGSKQDKKPTGDRRDPNRLHHGKGGASTVSIEP